MKKFILIIILNLILNSLAFSKSIEVNTLFNDKKNYEKMEMLFGDYRIYTHRPGAAKIRRISDNKQFLIENQLGYKKNEYEKISFTIDKLEDYISVANIIKKVKQEYKCEYYSKDFVRLSSQYIKSKGRIFLKNRNHPVK